MQNVDTAQANADVLKEATAVILTVFTTRSSHKCLVKARKTQFHSHNISLTTQIRML